MLLIFYGICFPVRLFPDSMKFLISVQLVMYCRMFLISLEFDFKITTEAFSICTWQEQVKNSMGL